MEMISVDDQPYSIVEDRGFWQLIEHIEPHYSLLRRRYFSLVSLPALHKVVATHIHKLLVSMLSLTAQWIDDNFEMKRAVLHAQEFAISHTGAAI